MLDQIDDIANLDTQDALGVIRDQPKQLAHAYAQPELAGYGEVDTIVVAGMGGSALAAEFLRSWLEGRMPVPVVISRDYRLPGYVGERTLVVCSSYSGNTEETLSALEDAASRGAKIVINASGGKLLEAAREKGYPFFELPGGLQPRLAVLYGVRALAQLLEGAGLMTGLVDELEGGAEWANGQVDAWSVEQPTSENESKRIAQALEGHPVVVYGGPTLALPAMKWKIDINENAKGLAFWNVIPEFNHNEFLGWSEAQGSDAFRVVLLRSELDHPQVQKRFDVSPDLLSGHMPQPVTVEARGGSKLEHMLYALLLGDFVSAYLAFLKGLDPTPVALIEELKGRLA